MTLPMTSQPIIADAFTYILYLILPYFIMLMFIPMVYRVTYRIVKEKELKTKEIMRMMGMKMAPYWMSWFVYFTIVNLFLSTVAWMFMYLPSAVYRNGEFHSYNKVIKYTDGFVLWLVIWMYGQSIFAFIMLLQSFFSDARTAGVVTTIIYFGLSVAF